MALISVVQDVGADRGFLLSEKGFQPAAREATKQTNIILTSLAELLSKTKHFMGSGPLVILDWRLAKLRKRLSNLHQLQKKSQYHNTPALLAKAQVNFLEYAFADACNAKFPIRYKPTEYDPGISAKTMSELVEKADKLIAGAEKYADKADHMLRKNRIAVIRAGSELVNKAFEFACYIHEHQIRMRAPPTGHLGDEANAIRAILSILRKLDNITWEAHNLISQGIIRNIWDFTRSVKAYLSFWELPNQEFPTKYQLETSFELLTEARCKFIAMAEQCLESKFILGPHDFSLHIMERRAAASNIEMTKLSIHLWNFE
jgi:hypothetical protein